MKRNNTPATTTQIENLVTVAKCDTNEKVRQQAARALWALCGEQIAGVMLKNSYKYDSDHAYHDLPAQTRRDDIVGKAYIAFLRWLDCYDLSRGVPFLAYTSKKSGWLMQDDKRKNSKRSRREKIHGKSGDSRDEDVETCPFDKELAENCDVNPFTGEVNSFEHEKEWCDLVDKIRCVCQKKPKMLRFFDAMVQVVEDGNNCTDAKVAEKMGCTRANTGVQHKKFLQFMQDEGMDQEFRLLLAA